MQTPKPDKIIPSQTDSKPISKLIRFECLKLLQNFKKIFIFSKHLPKDLNFDTAV